MNSNLIDFNFFSLSLPKDWSELLPDENEEEMPITIADPENGVGALQFSMAEYQGGKSPNFIYKDLLKLLGEFSEKRGLNNPFDQVVFSNDFNFVGQSYRDSDSFIRVWYVSNGKDIALITYLCDWEHRDKEKISVNNIVRSFRFRRDGQNWEGPKKGTGPQKGDILEWHEVKP